jgi:tRNA (guanine-N7-)-methyltransferase
VTSEIAKITGPVRSFVRRAGRITLAQREALSTLLPSYAVNMTTAFEKFSEFGRDGPCWLEIGFGNGQALLNLAGRFPEVNFIGAEVHDPGVGRLLMGLQEGELSNVRVHHGDVVELLRDVVPAGSLDRILLWFPDPWPKKRHHKRRLLRDEMVDLMTSKLSPGGILHTATDWEPYAEQMLEVLESKSSLTNVYGPGQFAPDPDVRPPTRFELRGRRLGHGVWDLRFATRLDEANDQINN